MLPATVCCNVIAASDAALVSAAFISATTDFASYTFSRCRISFSINALCLLNGLHSQGGMNLRCNYVRAMSIIRRRSRTSTRAHTPAGCDLHSITNIAFIELVVYLQGESKVPELISCTSLQHSHEARGRACAQGPGYKGARAAP